MSLNEQILARIQAFQGNDYDQRSALGMVRSWLDNGKLDTWNPERHKDMIEYPKRDQLAKDLVTILEDSGAEPDEMVAALTEARRVINEPYLDPTMNGQQNGKGLLKPKEKKGGK